VLIGPTQMRWIAWLSIGSAVIGLGYTRFYRRWDDPRTHPKIGAGVPVALGIGWVAAMAIALVAVVILLVLFLFYLRLIPRHL